MPGSLAFGIGLKRNPAKRRHRNQYTTFPIAFSRPSKRLQRVIPLTPPEKANRKSQTRKSANQICAPGLLCALLVDVTTTHHRLLQGEAWPSGDLDTHLEPGRC